MATAATTFIPTLHPAIAYQATLSRWNDDPAIAKMFEAVDLLDGASKVLAALRTDRPDVVNQSFGIGSIVQRYERRERIVGADIPGIVIKGEGGACASLWATVDGCRKAWIEAKLLNEGLRENSDAWFDEWNDYDGTAPTVQDAYLEYRRARS